MADLMDETSTETRGGWRPVGERPKRAGWCVCEWEGGHRSCLFYDDSEDRFMQLDAANSPRWNESFARYIEIRDVVGDERDAMGVLLHQAETFAREREHECGVLRAENERMRKAWEPATSEPRPEMHSNPDARAWAEYFIATFPNCGADEGLLHTWFANAMMAMYDHSERQHRREYFKGEAAAMFEAERDALRQRVGSLEGQVRELKRKFGEGDLFWEEGFEDGEALPAQSLEAAALFVAGANYRPEHFPVEVELVRAARLPNVIVHVALAENGEDLMVTGWESSDKADRTDGQHGHDGRDEGERFVLRHDPDSDVWYAIPAGLSMKWDELYERSGGQWMDATGSAEEAAAAEEFHGVFDEYEVDLDAVSFADPRMPEQVPSQFEIDEALALGFTHGEITGCDDEDDRDPFGRLEGL